jgi:hypothetical protein
MTPGPTELVNDILRDLSRAETRLFRQNAGFAWQGQVLEQNAHRLVLAHPRAIRLGVTGMSDLGGLTSILITPDMLGQRIAIDVQIEAKSGSGRATPEQRAYIEMIRGLGGRAGIARSVEEARQIVGGDLT